MANQVMPHTLRLMNGDGENVLLGYRIPYLPDFLASPHRIGSTDTERLREVLDSQSRLVDNLWKWQQSSFAIRYLYLGTGEVQVGFLARSRASTGKGQMIAEAMAADVRELLEGFGYPTQPMSSEELKAFTDPFPNPSIIDVRQQEDGIPLLFLGHAYVVYPFEPSATTWIPVFEALLRQRHPCVISAYLEPTRLTEAESSSLTRAATLAETGREQEVRAPMGTIQIVGRDPYAAVVARLYADLSVSLRRPFHVVAQIATPETDTRRAWALAQVLGAEATRTVWGAEAAAGDGQLPSGFEAVIPETSAERRQAQRMFSGMELRAWGQSKATEGKERLRYLADARRASAVFRFPVAMHGGIPGIRVKQPMPIFDVVPTEEPGQSIVLGHFAERGGDVHLPLHALNRHCLVAGTTGAGKTTTCIRIMAALWEQGIPTLVIEPAKTEYRGLLQSKLGQDLLIFSLGDESISPFRLNPLEIMPGVRVERHISYLKAAFMAAMPTFPILPSLVEESLYRIYGRKGWRFTDVGGPDDAHRMPVLDELYREVLRVAEERGYQDETMQDVRAAASGRIKSLLLGSKGHMLNTRSSIPFDRLMKQPTILELESLHDEEKATVMLFLLTALREYVRTTRNGEGLKHVTIIEEAHRIMARTSRVSDPEVAPAATEVAAGMFSAMLSETRAYGEGIVIAEQIPEHLATEALKNTNVKIIHQLPGEDDRRLLGGTTNMLPEQEAYVAKLEAGCAAFFAEGYERPTFVRVNKYPDTGQLPAGIVDARVREHMRPFYSDHPELFLPFSGCAFCDAQCTYRAWLALVVHEQSVRDSFRKSLVEFEGLYKEKGEDSAWLQLFNACRRVLKPLHLDSDLNALYCYWVHVSSQNVSQLAAAQFKATHQRLQTRLE